MKRLAFTIAFGPPRYRIMAEALKESLKISNPDLEFKIFSDGDFTPYEEGLPLGRKLYPKDYKYPKIEIMTRLRDPDTQYLFIDADCFVFCDLDHIFSKIEPNKLLMHWIYNQNGTWAGIPELRFADAWAKEGIEGLEPYSLNSGFIGWQGHAPAFDKALELIKTKTVMTDDKGRRGDEYYYCAGIQLTNTGVISTEDFPNELGMLWRGKLGTKQGMLTCAAYSEIKKIQHYGNVNWPNPHVQRLIEHFLRSQNLKEKLNRYAYTGKSMILDAAKAFARKLMRRRAAQARFGEI